jgi:hypothetical protein
MLLSVVTACEMPAVLPPPAAPAQDMPELASPPLPPPPGSGQVVIAADEPSRVEQVIGHTAGSYDDGTGTWLPYDEPVYAPVCNVTPCVTSLAFGAHDLTFTSTIDPMHRGTGSVTAGAAPVDHRFALGRDDLMPHFTSGLLTTAAGSTLFMTGVFLFAFTTTPAQPFGSGPWPIVGLSTAVIGGALTALGVHWLKDPGTTQPGTGVQWTPGTMYRGRLSPPPPRVSHDPA